MMVDPDAAPEHQDEELVWPQPPRHCPSCGSPKIRAGEDPHGRYWRCLGCKRTGPVKPRSPHQIRKR